MPTLRSPGKRFERLSDQLKRRKTQVLAPETNNEAGTNKIRKRTAKRLVRRFIRETHLALITERREFNRLARESPRDARDFIPIRRRVICLVWSHLVEEDNGRFSYVRETERFSKLLVLEHLIEEELEKNGFKTELEKTSTGLYALVASW